MYFFLMKYGMFLFCKIQKNTVGQKQEIGVPEEFSAKDKSCEKFRDRMYQDLNIFGKSE